MHEQYFDIESVNFFNPSWLFMLKLRLFGKRIVEYAGNVEAIWYLYRGKLYFVKYSICALQLQSNTSPFQ